jgi:hypothetical protein
MAMLSEKYIAGFFDADGCVSMVFPNKAGNPRIQLGFAQKTSQDKVIHLIQEVIGGSLSVYAVKGTEYTHLTLGREKSIAALNRIRKHLVVKRHYADVCLEMMERPITDWDAAKAYLKEQRKVRSLPLPNFPSRQWLAGYLDGDGCFSAMRRPGPTNVVCWPLVHVACSNFDTEGIDIVQKNFGGQIHDMRNGRCKQWTLYMQPSKAKEFLGYFSKHLIIKREQALFILGCAEQMGHFRDGKGIASALKHLKTQPHRLNDPEPDVSALLATIQDLPPQRGQWTGLSDSRNAAEAA